MDLRDEQSGRMEEIHQQLHFAYCQFPFSSHDLCHPHSANSEYSNSIHDLKEMKPGLFDLFGNYEIVGIMPFPSFHFSSSHHKIFGTREKRIWVPVAVSEV